MSVARWLDSRLMSLSIETGGLIVLMANLLIGCVLYLFEVDPDRANHVAEARPEAVTMKIDEADLDRMLSSLFLVCSVGGATGGAFVKIFMFPPRLKSQENRMRQMAAEFFAALCCGFLLTPMVMTYVPVMPVHPVSAMSMSTIIAICSTLIIHAIFRQVEKHTQSLEGRKDD